MGSEIWEVNGVKEEGLLGLATWRGKPDFLARCSSGQKLPESLCAAPQLPGTRWEFLAKPRTVISSGSASSLPWAFMHSLRSSQPLALLSGALRNSSAGPERSRGDTPREQGSGGSPLPSHHRSLEEQCAAGKVLESRPFAGTPCSQTHGPAGLRSFINTCTYLSAVPPNPSCETVQTFSLPSLLPTLSSLFHPTCSCSGCSIFVSWFSGWCVCHREKAANIQCARCAAGSSGPISSQGSDPRAEQGGTGRGRGKGRRWGEARQGEVSVGPSRGWVSSV